MEKRRNKFFILFTIAGTFLTAGLVMLGTLRVKNEIPLTSDLASEEVQIQAVKEEKVDIPSPDGKYTLTMKNSKEVGGVITQTFYITSEEEEQSSKPSNLDD